MDRLTVYEAINTERQYQEEKWQGHYHSIEEWLIYLDTYIDDLKKYLTHTPDINIYPKATDTLRKIAALSVAALEQHGCEFRQ